MSVHSWLFNTMRPSDKVREPIQGEFFAADAISDPGEALVREGIQNSLDAARPGERVIVRIRVSGDRAVARPLIAPFLAGLDEHLRAPGNGLREIPGDDEPCPVLIFEDFGTTGLLGDPAEWRPPQGSHNHFYHFFRAEGRSDKGEKDIGRWGVGKQVFPRASRINSIFGLTVRNDDRKKLLMGMAVLKSHDSNGIRYAPDGWFGRPSEGGDPQFVLPIDDPDFIDSFSQTFDVQRRDDPGLSVIVPWYDLDLTDVDLVRAVLRGYFWPILRGQLEVIVETESIQTILDASSIHDEVTKCGEELKNEIAPLLKLALWAKGLTASDFVHLKSSDPNKAWQWSKDLFTDVDLADLRNRYDRADRIAFRIPEWVREKNQTPKETYFDLFLCRDGAEQRGRPFFVREGIIIPDVRVPRTRGVRSLVNAEDGPIAAFLGDSENPAHTQWQKDGANFRGKYVSGASDLQFVIRAVHEIVSIVCEQNNSEDRTLLADLFFIPAEPQENEVKKREKKKPQKPGTEPEKPEPPKPHPKLFVIDRIQGGFVVRKGDKTAATFPQTILIRAAYQVRRGNPFKKYNSADFRFQVGMKTMFEGATLLETNDNVLKVKIDSDDFQIKVTGFDTRRDLRVDVRKGEDENAGTDA